MDITRESWNRTQDEIAKLRRQIDDQYFRSGDTVQFNLVGFVGFLTNSMKTMHFTIPVGKSLSHVSLVTVTTMTGVVYGAQGAVNGSGTATDWKGMVNVYANIKGDRLVDIGMTLSASVSNGVNNSPILYIPSNSTIGGLVLEFSHGDHVDGGILYLTGSQSVSGSTLTTSGSVSGGILTI